MKKALSLILALMMAFSLVACGGGSQPAADTQAPADTSEPATVPATEGGKKLESLAYLCPTTDK